MTRAFVLGGTGHLGEAVCRGFAAAQVPTTFSYFRSPDKARALAQELRQEAVELNVRDPQAIRALISHIAAPTAFVHCVTVAQSLPLDRINDDDWRIVHDINVHSAFVACQALAQPMGQNGGGNLILCAALDGLKSVPAPAHFAASQAALQGMTRALAKELGPRGIRVNLCGFGVLDGGIAEQLDDKLRNDYKRFSAMGRIGRAEEVARAIVWLALHNTYMTGATLMFDGGL